MGLADYPAPALEPPGAWATVAAGATGIPGRGTPPFPAPHPAPLAPRWQGCRSLQGLGNPLVRDQGQPGTRRGGGGGAGQPLTLQRLRAAARLRTSTLCEALTVLLAEGSVRKGPDGYSLVR